MAKKIIKVKVKKAKIEPEEAYCFEIKTEKEKLLELYKILQDKRITRISDLENQIANCKD